MELKRLIIITLFLALFLGVTSAFSETSGERLVLVDENTNLQLFYDSETTGIIVFDKRNEREWRSIPEFTEEEEALTGLLQKYLLSPFILTYADGTRDRTFQAIISTAIDEPARTVQVSTSHSFHDGELIIDYSLFEKTLDGYQNPRYEGNIKWQVRFKIGPDYLEMEMPDDSIVEDGDFSAVSIEMMPYFGANKDRTGGSLIIPLGNGVLIPYTEVNPSFMRGFSFPIYGEDKYDFSMQRQSMTNLLPEQMTTYLKTLQTAPDIISLPMFAMISRGDGLFCTATSGEKNANIEGGKAGYITNFNRMWFKWILREQFSFPLSRTSVLKRYRKQREQTTPVWRYYFIPGPGIDVPAVANRYQQFLIDEQNAQPAKDDSLINLRIFCAIEKQSLFGKKLVPATTFEQAVEIIRLFVERNMTRVTLTLVGWGNGGFYGSSPVHMPPDKRLGGTKGLNELVEFAHSNGIQIFLETDYLIALDREGGFSKKSDSAKLEFDIPLSDQSGAFITSPRVALERYARDEVPQIKELGVDGMLVRGLAEVLISDRDKKNYSVRDDTVKYWNGILEEILSHDMSVAITGRNGYMLPYVDSIQDLEIGVRTYREAREEIPFYQIALRGLITFFGTTLNLSENPGQDFLKMIEYGVFPSFELTYENPVILRDTSYNFLFSSKWTDWVDPIQSFYERLEILEPIRESLIFEHRQLAPGVKILRYEKGETLVINYNKHSFEYNGYPIRAEDFLLIGADREMK